MKSIKSLVRQLRNKIYQSDTNLLFRLTRDDYLNAKSNKKMYEVPSGYQVVIGSPQEFTLPNIHEDARDYYDRSDVNYLQSVFDKCTVLLLKTDKERVVGWVFGTKTPIPSSRMDYNLTIDPAPNTVYAFNSFVAPKHRYQGMAKALYRCFFDNQFANPNIRHMDILIAEHNRPSIAVAKYFNFQVVQTLNFLKIFGVVVRCPKMVS